MDSVTAAILAGGHGTRLHPVVADRPKVLAAVRGRPFLSYLLDQVATGGISEVVVCTGYLGEQVGRVFGHAYGRLRLRYSHESAPLGTAGALRLALPLFTSEAVLVMNGDSYCDADLRAFGAWHCARGAEATILLTEVPDTKRYGRVCVDSDGVVVGFAEKDGESRPGWINAGIYLLRSPLLQTIPAEGMVSLEREMFPAWIGRGLYGYQYEGRFLDIGTPEAYAMAESFFAQDSLT